MGSLGTPEIIIILAVALIVFGPKKLPEIGRSIGQGLRELRKASREIVESVENEISDLDPLKETVNDASHSDRNN